jgi:signal transduction histidine kinase
VQLPAAAMAGPAERGGIDATNLPAIAAHELNNIGVPLMGFIDLLAQSTPASEATRPYLEELRIGAARVAVLASDLESLAQWGSNPARCAIGNCLPAAIEVDWQCSASTKVSVDSFHALRAVDALARVARTATGQDAPAALTVSEENLQSAACAVCGIVMSARRKYVLVRADGTRLATAGVLRNPLGPGSAGRAGSKLGLAVLVHCVHRAGGHLLLDDGAASISIALLAD